MRIILCILFTFILSGISNAQPFINIYLSSIYPESRGATFSQILETHEIRVPNKETPTIFNITKTYNTAGKILLEVKKNSLGGKSSETKWEYLPNGNLKKKSTDTFINMRGWISEVTVLNYNDSTGHLEEILDLFDSKIRRKAHISCDEKGFPLEVKITNNDDVLIGTEKIITIPASNCIRVLCFNATDQFINAHNYPINPKLPVPKSTLIREYNQQGDVIIEMLSQKSKMNQGYFYEYEYDSHNNWTLKRTFQCSVNSNNKPKNKKLEYLITRKITY